MSAPPCNRGKNVGTAAFFACPGSTRCDSLCVNRRPILTPHRRSKWLLWRLLLIWAESDRSKDKILGHDLLAQGLQSTAPAKVIGQVLRRDAMEGTQPFLEAAVVGIDVVDVEIGCLRVGLAGHWQDVGWDASPA